MSISFQDYKAVVNDLKQEIKQLKKQEEKTTMENCILADFQTEVQSFMTMNDVDDLDELDTAYNNLKQKLEKIKGLQREYSIDLIEIPAIIAVTISFIARYRKRKE